MKSLPSGEYVISGRSDGNGAGSGDFLLLTLSEDFSSCGNLITHDVAVQSRDVTHHSDRVFQDIAFNEDLTYSATISYTDITPTSTDIMPQFTTFNGK